MKKQKEIPYRDLDYIKDNPVSFEIQHFIKKPKDKMPHDEEGTHRHNFYILAFVNEAVGGSSVDFKTFLTKEKVKKIAMVIRPEQVHIPKEVISADTMLMRFTKDFLQSDRFPILDENENVNLIRLTQKEYDTVYRLVENVYEEFYSNGEWKYDIIQSHLNSILALLSRFYLNKKPKEKLKDQNDDIPAKFKKLVNENYISTRKVEDYASKLYVSAGHLNDLVKQKTGKSAKDLINERLLLEAKRLLYYNDNSIKEICEILQFNEMAYFSRFFKNHTGKSPNDFRLKFLRKNH